MPDPDAGGLDTLVRRVLGGLIALALTLACTVLWVAALTTAPMTGTAGMTDVAGVQVAATTVIDPAVVAELGTDVEATMASVCDTGCVDGAADVCTLGAALAVVTVMALLLSSRRDTFLGLLVRPRISVLVQRPRWPSTPWTVLSLSSLGVLRV